MPIFVLVSGMLPVMFVSSFKYEDSGNNLFKVAGGHETL